MRYLSPEVAHAMDNDFDYCHLVRLDFKSGPVYITDYGYSLDHGGAKWLANGWLISISGINNTSEMRSGELTVVLNALDDEVIAYALNHEHRNQTAQFFRAYLDDKGQILPDPIELWIGDMTRASIASDGANSGVGFTVSTPWAAFDKSNPWRTSNESQYKRNPNDNAFKFASRSLKEVDWGG